MPWPPIQLTQVQKRKTQIKFLKLCYFQFTYRIIVVNSLHFVKIRFYIKKTFFYACIAYTTYLKFIFKNEFILPLNEVNPLSKSLRYISFFF